MFWAQQENYRRSGQEIRWALKQSYQMYGEYLENLRKPYPKYLLKRTTDETVEGK